MGNPPIQFCRRLPPEIQISKNMNYHTKHKQTNKHTQRNTCNALLGSPPLPRRSQNKATVSIQPRTLFPNHWGGQAKATWRDVEKPGNSASWGSDWALAAHFTRPMVQVIVRGSACYTHSYSISSCSELVDFHVRFRVALRRLTLGVIINMYASVLRSHVLKTAVAHHWHAMSTHSTIRSR